jgi:D-arabinose 1-dehydrogenase-like Zn-dependent alcohol dehydrogenase
MTAAHGNLSSEPARHLILGVRFAGQRFGLVAARGPKGEHVMTEKKVWLITGAGRGLGVDIAKAALAAGHSVVATGRDAAKVEAAVGQGARLWCGA